MIFLHLRFLRVAVFISFLYIFSVLAQQNTKALRTVAARRLPDNLRQNINDDLMALIAKSSEVAAPKKIGLLFYCDPYCEEVGEVNTKNSQKNNTLVAEIKIRKDIKKLEFIEYVGMEDPLWQTFFKKRKLLSLTYLILKKLSLV